MGPLLAAGIMTGANIIGSLVGQGMQRRENRRARKYNSPKKQMARYLAAGLNPNLVYTQGSAGSYGDTINYADAYSNVGSSYIGAAQTSAQTELAQSKQEESEAKQDLIVAQKEVLQANPYLNEEYVKAMVMNMTATAKMKDQEMRYKLQEFGGAFGDTWYRRTEQGFAMMDQQINLLFQKYNLNKADLKMKAEIFQGKDFENDLKKIQLDWMKSGEITPQHIYQGIMMILSKMM